MQNILDYVDLKAFKKFKLSKNFSYETGVKYENGQIKPEFALEGEIPIEFITIRGKISDEGFRFGSGFGNSNKLYIGVFNGFENGELIKGLELNALGGNLHTEGLAGYNWEEDKLSLKASFEVFGQKVKLANFEIKDALTNTLGKGIDFIGNSLDGIHKHISPQEKAKIGYIKEFGEKADKVHNVNDLGEFLIDMGQNQLMIKGNEPMFQAVRATFNCVSELNNRVNENTEDINQLKVVTAIHGERLDLCEKRLDQHDQLLKIHGAILNYHEKRLIEHDRILKIHGAILNYHERRLNRHEQILNIHENRLNEHDRILSIHNSILREHEERLNIHAIKINELDQRMSCAEKNIDILGKQVDFHSKILANHEDILKNHSECINELYNITHHQQIQLRMDNEAINDHQMEILKLIYNYHDLKDRIENDEKVINQIGEEVAKVTNFAIDTRSIVDGLAYQTQVHKDLIIQNHNDIVNLYNEIQEQANFIIAHGNILKEITSEIYYQKKILYQHEEKIIELQRFVKNISKEIKNIYIIFNNLEERVTKLEKEFYIFKINTKLKEINEQIKTRVKEMVKKVKKFNDDEKADFIKCCYISILTGNFNLDHLEIVINKIKP